MRHAYTLDALRLAASLALVVGHLTTEATVPATIGNLLLGGLSSAMFFLLAGYLGAATPGLFERPIGATLWRRSMRLLPPHWIGFALLLPFAFRLPWEELGSAILWWGSGMQNLAPAGTFSQRWNFPAWAVTPLLLGSLSLIWLRLGKVNEWGPRSLIPLLGGILLVRMGLDLLPFPPLDSETSIARHTANLPRLLEVQAGAIAALLFRNPPRWLAADLTVMTLLLASIGLLLGGAAIDGKPGIYIVTHGLFAPLGVLLVASAFHNEGRVASFCRLPWIVRGGQISILLWMLHIPVDTVCKHLAVRLGFGLDWLYTWPFILISMTMTLIAARLGLPLVEAIRSNGKPGNR